MMKQFDHMIERKLNLELSNVFPRLSNVFPRLKFLTGCGQFSDFSNIWNTHLLHTHGSHHTLLISHSGQCVVCDQNSLHDIVWDLFVALSDAHVAGDNRD
jgi:hypothetical protein